MEHAQCAAFSSAIGVTMLVILAAVALRNVGTIGPCFGYPCAVVNDDGSESNGLSLVRTAAVQVKSLDIHRERFARA